MSQWQPQGYDPRRRQQGQDPWSASQQPSYQPSPQQSQQWQQPQYQPPTAPPPRKRHRLRIFSLGCFGFVGLVVIISVVAASKGTKTPAGATFGSTGTSAPASTTAQATGTVTFKVTGSDASVTYGPAGTDIGGTAPMSVTKPLGTPIYYSLMAQLQGGGAVTCEILVNGTLLSQSSASGGYNVASCEITRDPFSGKWKSALG